MTSDAIEAEIRRAFAGVERPGNWALRCSSEGDEPYEVEAAFADKDDWRTIEPGFLDTAPDGLASALSTFTPDEARAIVAYLHWREEKDDFDRDTIGQAIRSYWNARTR